MDFGGRNSNVDLVVSNSGKISREISQQQMRFSNSRGQVSKVEGVSNFSDSWVVSNARGENSKPRREFSNSRGQLSKHF